jgi:NAD(P)-dependent dehydrogenase (short-subunit alcohol dehydrogenase family)
MARFALVSTASRDIGGATARLAAKRGCKAEAIRWLLSDEASYVAGAVLPITGVP